jgi:xylulokinase
MAPGDWNSTLGTTLVIKGVTERLLLDPLGRIYSHRHPDGYWLPGGASNTGGEALAGRFPPESWRDLNAHVLAVAPTDTIIYPLTRTGERFPFACPTAAGFSLNLSGGEITSYPPQSGDLPAASPLFSSATWPPHFLVADYAAHLEGVGYVERLAYETLTEIGAVIGPTIYSAGGATRSRAWSQLRADILGRVLVRPEVTGGAMGAAIIAAAGVWYRGIIPATRAMVRLVEQIEPRPALASAYEERYRRFREVCIARGYQ